MHRQYGKNAVPFSETAFGDLPPELRNEIYKLALTIPTGAKPNMHSHVFLRHKYPTGFRKDGLLWYSTYWRSYVTRPQKWLGLLQTCRQVHQEAVHLFYHMNKIGFHRPSALARFCKDFPDRVVLLTSIHIDNTCEYPLELMETLAQCRGLRHLSLVYNKCTLFDYPFFVRCCEPEVKLAIRELRGFETVDFRQESGPTGHECTDCPSWACPYNVLEWTPKQINIAEKIRYLMLRPRLTSNGTCVPGQTLDATDCSGQDVDLAKVNEQIYDEEVDWSCSGEDGGIDGENGEDTEEDEAIEVDEDEESDEITEEEQEDSADDNEEPARKKLRLDNAAEVESLESDG